MQRPQLDSSAPLVAAPAAVPAPAPPSAPEVAEAAAPAEAKAAPKGSSAAPLPPLPAISGPAAKDLPAVAAKSVGTPKRAAPPAKVNETEEHSTLQPSAALGGAPSFAPPAAAALAAPPTPALAASAAAASEPARSDAAPAVAAKAPECPEVAATPPAEVPLPSFATVAPSARAAPAAPAEPAANAAPAANETSAFSPRPRGAPAAPAPPEPGATGLTEALCEEAVADDAVIAAVAPVFSAAPLPPPASPEAPAAVPMVTFSVARAAAEPRSPSSVVAASPGVRAAPGATEASAGGAPPAAEGAPAPAVQDSPGLYIIVHNNTFVSHSVTVPSTEKEVIAQIEKGKQIRVLEVAAEVEQHRVRARIESPAGWISLCNLENGYRWARPLALSEDSEELHALQADIQTVVQDNSSLHEQVQRLASQMEALRMCNNELASKVTHRS